MGCSRDFCKILSHAGRADRCFANNLKANLLSAEAKVLAAVIDNPFCIIKEIPILTGLSDRHAYNAINKLVSYGFLNKEKSNKDGRMTVINLDKNKMCNKICALIQFS